MLDVMYEIPSQAEHQRGADLRGGGHATKSSRSCSTRRRPRPPDERDERACSFGTTTDQGPDRDAGARAGAAAAAAGHHRVPAHGGPALRRPPDVDPRPRRGDEQAEVHPARGTEGRQDQRAGRGGHLPGRHARQRRAAAAPPRRHREGADRGQAARARRASTSTIRISSSSRPRRSPRRATRRPSSRR